MKLNGTRRLLGAISLTSFELVYERIFFHSIVETSDAPLNVITIFVVSCRTITVIIFYFFLRLIILSANSNIFSFIFMLISKHIFQFILTPQVRLVVVLFFELKMWRAFRFFKNVNAAFSRMKLNETRRLLGAILLTSFELVYERNFFHSIVKTSDAPLNVITIFVVSCRR